jgi:RNA polymerase sigma-70 factor, ECF subfamily
MHTTPVSLLERLCRPADREAWDQFVDLYTPLLYHWARHRAKLSAQEAADLVQDVFLLLMQKLPKFRYDPHRTFRGWLRTVLLNKWKQNVRRRPLPTVAGVAALADVADPEPTSVLEDDEYRHYVARRALQMMQAMFKPPTWKACWECVVNGRTVVEVANELGMTPNAVCLAKARVLRRLRQELQGLLD